MSYLLDKQNQRKRFFKIAGAVFLFIILFYFKIPVYDFLSSSVHFISRPLLVLKNSTGKIFGGLGSIFYSKNSLITENESLRLELAENKASMANYDTVLDENNKLKEILDRKGEKRSLILSAILAKPNRSLYDTLIIDVGSDHGLKDHDVVYALGNIPIGYIQEVYVNSSKVVLFSNSGEKTDVVVSGNQNHPSGDVFLQIVGRGGGNFEMIMPRDFTVTKGDVFSLPGINSEIVARVETTLSDPRDSFAKALLATPVNIQELKFVQIKK
jgi:cell shape-determining protein MreC